MNVAGVEIILRLVDELAVLRPPTRGGARPLDARAEQVRSGHVSTGAHERERGVGDGPRRGLAAGVPLPRHGAALRRRAGGTGGDTGRGQARGPVHRGRGARCSPTAARIIQRHDLPLTKGLRALLHDVDALAHEIDVQPILAFLLGAGLDHQIDELVHAEVPRLTAALVLLAGRIIAILEPGSWSPQERIERLLRPPSGEPTPWEVERAARVLDLTL